MIHMKFWAHRLPQNGDTQTDLVQLKQAAKHIDQLIDVIDQRAEMGAAKLLKQLRSCACGRTNHRCVGLLPRRNKLVNKALKPLGQ
jgi:hypothetical protein